MNTFLLKVSTPEGEVYKADVNCLSVRGTEGDLAVMSGHIPLITAVKPCICNIEDEIGKIYSADIGEGILAVSADETILLVSKFDLR